MEILTAERVRTMALEGRVKRGKEYHGHEHGLRFGDVVRALERCFRVEPDRRVDADGALRHPDGFIAFGNGPAGRTLRIDFDLELAEDGGWLVVVTAFEVGPP